MNKPDTGQGGDKARGYQRLLRCVRNLLGTREKGKERGVVQTQWYTDTYLAVGEVYAYNIGAIEQVQVVGATVVKLVTITYQQYRRWPPTE